jgi:sarcosine oxidase
MRLDAEVAVIGMGAMGSMALWQLAEHGIRALGFEQFAIGHDRGASYGESRMIRTAYFEDPRYVPLVQRAFGLWRTLESISSTRLLLETGMLVIGPPTGELVGGALQSMRAHNLAYQVLDRDEMRRRYPQHCLRSQDVAVYEQPAGILFPEACIRAAAMRAETLGSQILPDTQVMGISARGDVIEVVAAPRGGTIGGATYRVRTVIVGVGPWLGSLFPELGLPISVTRQVVTWVRVRNPEGFRPERFPIFLREIEGGRVCYGFPTLDSETIKLGVHREGRLTTADAIDREAHSVDLAPIKAFARHYLPGADSRVARTHICMYANTPDHHFLIGSPPGKPWMIVLGGFSGHGFKFAPVIGEAVANQVASGRNEPAFELFSLDRFSAQG